MKEEQLYYKAIHENLAPPERIYRSITARKSKSYIPRKIALTAAAFLAIFVIAVACIPEARAAVMSWLKPAVDPRAYLNTPVEERESVPAVNKAIEHIDAQPITVAVTDTADDAWAAWAGRLSVRFDELLYDGETLHITGALIGNTSDFVKPIEAYTVIEYDDGTGLQPPDDMVSCITRYSLDGRLMEDTRLHPLKTDFEPAYVSECISAGEVPLSMELNVGAGLTGRQTLALDLMFANIAAIRESYINQSADGDSDAPASYPVQAALHIEGLTFDATAGTAANNTLPRPAPVSLSGDVLVFSGEENAGNGTAMVGNDRLSLDGGTLSVLKMQQKLTGTAITLGLSLPTGWTQKQCSMLSDRISVEFILDGKNQGGFGSAYMGIRYYSDAEGIAALGLENPPDVSDPHNIVFSVDTGLMPEDWAHIQSFDIVLCIDELLRYNHAELPTDGRVCVPIEENGWNEDSERKRMDGCALTVK